MRRNEATLSVSELQLRLRKAIDSLLERNEGRPEAVDTAFDVIRTYDTLAGKLYQLRASRPKTDSVLQRTEDFVAGISHELISVQEEIRGESFYKEWLRGYRAIWRRELPLFIFTLVLFIASALLGWNIAVNSPEFAAVLIPQQGMENAIEKTPWFENLQDSPIIQGLMIAWNNIQVAITCFTLGALLGLGGLGILCSNGVFFGALLGYCYVQGFHEQLTDFVLGHGPLELTIIIASAFASMLYGRVFYMRPYRLFGKRMARGGKDALYVLTGILPWLLVAASVESLVSPFHYLSLSGKLALGILLAFSFWAWTFWPSEKEVELN